MHIIPVIDLKDGVVVHAKLGHRSHYLPIESQISTSSMPLDIVAALLELYPFQTLYIADLDAILGVGEHRDTIETICQTYPQLTIWLDCGIRQMNDRALYLDKQIKPVVGSENIQSLQDYRAISYACQSKHVLSLDYTATSYMGISELHDAARFWPDDTICMTLNAVGSNQGIDFERLNTLIKMNGTRKSGSRIYAAGGVRNLNDLRTLAGMGITGALIATALHNKQLTADDIKSLGQ